MNALHGYTPAEDGLTNEQFHDQVRRHMVEAKQLRAQAMHDAARGSIAFLIQPLQRWLSQRRRQRMVHDELASYSDPELADTGIHRADIPAVARKAA